MWLPVVVVLAATRCYSDAEAGDADGGDDAAVEADARMETEAEEEWGREDSGAACVEEFWVVDLTSGTPRDVLVCASPRGEGEHARVWVEDEEWGVAVTETAVAAILRAWDEETPAGSLAPAQGIFEVLTAIFGDPPDVFDRDPKIQLLIVGMEGLAGLAIDAFFRPEDEGDGPHSNRREMIHINAHARHPPGSAYANGVLAHELAHMIHWRYDPPEEPWLNETLAEAAMAIAGYTDDFAAAQGWARSPAAPVITDGSSRPIDYGAVFLFGAYLRERLGDDGLASLMADPAHGTVAVEAAVRRREPEATFAGFFADFAAAVLLDDPTIDDGRYGFAGWEIESAGATALRFPATAELTVPAGGIALARVALDGAAHAAIGVDIDAPAAAQLGARVAVIDHYAGNRVFVATPGEHLTIADVPATAAAIGVALAAAETLPVRAAVTVAGE